MKNFNFGSFFFGLTLLLWLCFCLFLIGLRIVNPCHPWIHAINDANYCKYCGEQLNCICECGYDVTDLIYCPVCGLKKQ